MRVRRRSLVGRLISLIALALTVTPADASRAAAQAPPTAIPPGDGVIAPSAADVPVQWRRFPATWTNDDRRGPSDSLGRYWHEAAFDDASWSGLTLPTTGFDIGKNDRYFRGRFTVEVLNATTLATLYFISDDGVEVFINGQRLNAWGNGWRQTGCVNGPPTCVNSVEVPVQVIPNALLRPGENVVAVDLWNSDACCFYFFNATVTVAWQELTPPVSRGTLLLVHGFQGFSLAGSSSCKVGFGRYGSPGVLNTFGDMAEWFADAGYEVWIARLDSSPLFTPPIEVNADCLLDQIRDTARLDQSSEPITLVAHSMGGLVARACLSMSECRAHVRALHTLGTPHAGIFGVTLLKLAGLLVKWKTTIDPSPYCLLQDAFCQLSSESMALFNARHVVPDGMVVSFVGGTNEAAPFGSLLRYSDGKNDGIVGANSAVGLFNVSRSPATLGAMPRRHWVKESHSRGRGAPSYFDNNGGAGSQAFRCVRSLLDQMRDPQAALSADCRTPNTEFAGVADEAVAEVRAMTADISGTIGIGQTATHALQVDGTGRSIFHLMWLSGTLSFTLTRPDGLTITPAFAAANPSVVAYHVSAGSPDLPPVASYSFTATVPGTYALTVTAADDVGAGGTSYIGFAAMESSRALSATTNATVFSAGETIMLSATLSGGGGVAVVAELIYADGGTTTVGLVDQGGVYRGSAIARDVPGYAVARVKAADPGGTFARQTDLVLAVAPHGAKFTGAFADRREDTNGDGFGDALAVDAQIAVTRPGTYTVSAELMAGGDAVASEMAFVTLLPGQQTVTLRFSGEEIRAAQRDGPYTVANLTLVDLDVGGLPADARSLAWTTQAYRWSQFGVVRRHLPAVMRP